MLVISDKDIRESVSLNEIMQAVETAMIYYEKKEFNMPERVQIEYGNKTLLLMPCFTNTTLGTKLVTVFPENIQKKQPILQALMIINDVELGKPLAIINGSELTALRTGAVGGVSIRHLTSESLTTLGIIGAGMQGFHQALFATRVRNITDIFVYDIQSDKVAKFMLELSRRRPEMIIHQSNSVEELLEQTELVITATTSSNPVLPNKTELLRGKHFVGIGSYKPSMREYPEAIFKVVDRVYVDTYHAIDESGDLIVPLTEEWIDVDKISTLGEFIIGEHNKANLKGNTTFFKSVGMALFDLIVSNLILHKAREKGLGKEVDI